MTFAAVEQQRRYEEAYKRLRELTDSAGLDETRARIGDLEQTSTAPGFWDDQETARTTMQELERGRQDLAVYEKLAEKHEEIELLLEMVSEDPAAIEEAVAALEQFASGVDALEFRRMFRGDHDRACAILEINSGAGGTEAQDWAEMLKRMYLRWAERHGFKVELLSELPGEEAGIKNVSLRIEGDMAYGWLKSENGVHRLVRISPFDSSARRHTSFASVFAMPEIEEDDEIEIVEKDLRVDTFRASGAGGQHINKTDSAIRITHLPTNIVVSCQNDRSQHKNRATALKMLRSRLFELRERERQAELNEMQSGKQEIAWGSQIRSYVLHPYRMVKDHRTNAEVGNADGVLDGDLDSFIEAYLRSGMGT